MNNIRIVHFSSSRNLLLFLTVLLLVVIRLMLFNIISPHVRYSPIDDNLYVERAFELLSGNFFGDFNAYTLAKLPGISYWIYFSRSLHIPYFVGINALYILSGIYVLYPLRHQFKKAVLLFAFAIYLINPITFSLTWFLPMREPLSSVLMIAMLGSCLNFMNSTHRVYKATHYILFCLIFSFSMLLREEDTLLWVYLLGFVIIVVHAGRKNLGHFLRNAFIILLLPALCAISVNHAVRLTIKEHYGLPIINDFNEGQFPKMVAAIRSVHSKTDNRLVMMPIDVIQTLRQKIPEFSRIAEHLPSPGPYTFSCRLQGVCKEWGNGWAQWFMKESVYELGYANSLVESQVFFKKMTEKIQKLCSSGELDCASRGDGIIPRMELRWSRAYLRELQGLIGLLLLPKLEIVDTNDGAFVASKKLINIYHEVLMIPSSQSDNVSNTIRLVAKNILLVLPQPLALIGSLIAFILILLGTIALFFRWVMYPGVAPTSLNYVFTLFWIYSLFRLLVLSYVAVFMGPYESRIVFSTYTGLLLFSPIIIWDCIKARLSFKLISVRYENV